MFEPKKPSTQSAIITADLKITGDLVSAGDIHVEGEIHGNITCRAFTLGDKSVINGSVEAETALICGIFDGKLRAKKVTLTEATKMKGEIYYETLKIEPGASFDGSVSCLKERK